MNISLYANFLFIEKSCFLELTFALNQKDGLSEVDNFLEMWVNDHYTTIHKESAMSYIFETCSSIAF